MSYARAPLNWIKRLLTDPALFWQLFVLVLVGEAVLSVLIVKFVPYTEIDWIAYCQEVEGFLSGDYNYANLRGDTGPLVYPAGFVYIYSALYFLTDHGKNILLGQYIFVGFYLLTVAIVIRIYQKAARETSHVPNWVVLLLAASRRVHSIYMLRLFNDGVAMLLFFGAMLLLMQRRYLLANVLYSLAVSVKMNILLFAPSWLIVLWHAVGFWMALPYLLVCAIVQLALAYPFLATFPLQYVHGAFDFGRVFLFRWTVNWKFLPEHVFVSKPLALALLGTHVLLLFLYLDNRACKHDGGFFKLLFRKAFSSSSSSSSSSSPTHRQVSNQFIVTILFIGNFIGIVCARSLHYQFYSWYFFTLPWLLWQTDLPVIVRLLMLCAIELCWNVFPARPWSSGLLCACHVALLAALMVGDHATPQPLLLLQEEVMEEAKKKKASKDQ